MNTSQRLTNTTPPQPSYLISDNVVFLTIADKSYPRKLAFSFLDELSKEFASTYGPKVEAVRKPYAFVGFG
jgi:vesicle transport protein SEC22